MSEKVFRDTRTQIGILKSRGLVIKNASQAKRIIRKTNYYNLINGYKDPFILTTTPFEKYIPGTHLEELYALYEFDRKLRITTLEEILKVEKQVKTIIAYCFSKQHGHRDYLRFENFDTNGSSKFVQVSSLLSDLYKKIKLNEKDDAVQHYVDSKNYLPLWVLVNAISMGDMSKFFSNMLQSERDEVAKRIKWGIREKQLSTILYFLSSVRNRCAHDERLYCFHSHVSIGANNYHAYFHSKNKNGYFSVLIAFKMLLPREEYTAYQRKVEGLLNELNRQLKSIGISKIRAAMDLPSNWKKLSSLK